MNISKYRNTPFIRFTDGEKGSASLKNESPIPLVFYFHNKLFTVDSKKVLKRDHYWSSFGFKLQQIINYFYNVFQNKHTTI